MEITMFNISEMEITMFNIRRITVITFVLCCLAGCGIKEEGYELLRSDTTHRALMYQTGTSEDATFLTLELEDGSITIATGPSHQLTVEEGYVSSNELTQGRELFTEELIALYKNTNHFPAIEADTQATDTQATSETQLLIEDTDQLEDGDSLPSLNTPGSDTDVDESWETLAMINIIAPRQQAIEETIYIDLNNIPNDETSEMLTLIENLIAKHR